MAVLALAAGATGCGSATDHPPAAADTAGRRLFSTGSGIRTVAAR